jgi:hypothetical protein
MPQPAVRPPAVVHSSGAIMLAAQDPGPINVFAFSGGATAFAVALQYVPSSVASRISNVVYVSPAGMGGMLPSGSDATAVVMGNSLIDLAVVSNIPADASIISTKCGHDANCEFREQQNLLAKYAGTPCSSQALITPQNVVSLAGSMGSGSSGGPITAGGSVTGSPIGDPFGWASLLLGGGSGGGGSSSKDITDVTSTITWWLPPSQ